MSLQTPTSSRLLVFMSPPRLLVVCGLLWSPPPLTACGLLWSFGRPPLPPYLNHVVFESSLIRIPFFKRRSCLFIGLLSPAQIYPNFLIHLTDSGPLTLHCDSTLTYWCSCMSRKLTSMSLPQKILRMRVDTRYAQMHGATQHLDRP